MPVEVYTDGACRGNPGPGGWAAILIYGRHRRELSGAAAETTNNRMELTAAIRALEALKKPSEVVLHTDSTYVKRGITEWVSRWQRNGWHTASRRAVENQDLWRRLVAAEQRHTVRWEWVRGHTGVPENEKADVLARAAAAAVQTEG